MKKVENQTEGELNQSLKHTKEELEKLEYEIKCIFREEEKEGEEINKCYIALVHMEECCSAEDKKLKRLIHEKRNMLKGLEKNKLEFRDRFLQETKKQKQEMEDNIESIHQQIAKE